MLSATPVAAAHGGGGGGGDRLLILHNHHHHRRSGAPPPPPTTTTPMAVAEAAAAAAAALPCSLEDPSRKVRKPYTITKSRESWSELEHDKFLEALQLFDRNWKKIEAFVGSKTVIQIRSHAQKYFLKVQKNGTSEHVPPARPKRKAAHPYPQKAPKNAAIMTQAVTPLPASSLVLKPCCAVSSDSSTVVRHSTSNATLSSCVNGSVRPFGASQITEVPSEAIMANNSCSTTESPTEMWLASETTEKENQVQFFRVMPDFSQVYSFLASVFDPNASGHLEKLKEMDPIDVETVLLLMRNLSVNLTSPDFEAHRRLLSTYGSGTEEANSNSFSNLLQSSKTREETNSNSFSNLLQSSKTREEANSNSFCNLLQSSKTPVTALMYISNPRAKQYPSYSYSLFPSQNHSNYFVELPGWKSNEAPRGIHACCVRASIQEKSAVSNHFFKSTPGFETA